MKVPIRYKSSDRYNAGVDVVYDDDSKLQYAPFIYATTASGDNGGDGGDEEGEDSMVVNINVTEAGMSLDKTWQEIYDAVGAGKSVYIKQSGSENELAYYIMHIDAVAFESSYYVRAHNVAEGLNEGEVDTILYMFETGDASGYPFYSTHSRVRSD